MCGVGIAADRSMSLAAIVGDGSAHGGASAVEVPRWARTMLGHVRGPSPSPAPLSAAAGGGRGPRHRHRRGPRPRSAGHRHVLQGYNGSQR